MMKVARRCRVTAFRLVNITLVENGRAIPPVFLDSIPELPILETFSRVSG